jgi:uncharacterized protein (TIGR02611 family)
VQLRRTLSVTYRTARRIAVGVVGGTVLVIGLLLIVLPGPAVVVIPLGLAILGIEFAWARRWLRKAKQQIRKTVNTPEKREEDDG